MLDRLQIVKQRFDEISDLIIQPDVISDQKRYALNQEYKTLKALAEKAMNTCFLANIEEANEIDNSDADMTEMAKMQLDEAKGKITRIRGRDQTLIPKDPEDAKNVMVEIRAGTGDEEYFAGDLFQNVH
jgi:peptide chain release factor 1